MANASLALLAPAQGLYALMLGTPIAAVATSSVFLNVATTGAMALAVRDALRPLAAADRAEAIAVLALLVGAIQLALGVVRAGSWMRFVSNSVMRGFLSGVSVSIILSQVPDLTGYTSDFANRVLRLGDTLLHPLQIHLTTLAVGVGTAALVLGLQRTRLRAAAMAISVAAVTLVVVLLPGMSAAVRSVSDIAGVPGGLPRPALPPVRLVSAMVLPAVAVALIGLVQAAGVSKSVPNPDRAYPDISRDFAGQGAANIGVSLFGGMPVGGSLASTALNVSAGAVSRWANVFSALTVGLSLVLIGPYIGLVPLPAMAALLVIAAAGAIRIDSIVEVWSTSVPARVAMGATFVGVLVVPLQYAVLVGVALSLLQYVYKASLDIDVVEVVAVDGRRIERRPPERLPSKAVTVLDIYGSMFFAGAPALDRLLPDPLGSRRAAVVLRLRGRTFVGSTEIQLLGRYSERLRAEEGRLLLAGVGPELAEQLDRSGLRGRLGSDNVYLAGEEVYDSVDRAERAARAWLDERSSVDGV